MLCRAMMKYQMTMLSILLQLPSLGRDVEYTHRTGSWSYLLHSDGSFLRSVMGSV